MRPSIRLALFALLSISLTSIFSTTMAVAHSGVVSSNPSAGQVLTELPIELSVTFSEELLVIEGKAVNTLTLTSQDRTVVPLTEIRVEGNLIRASVSAGDFPAGFYEMKYRVISADGHEVSDVITFSLNTPKGVVVTSESMEVGTSWAIPLPIALALAVVIAIAGFLLFQRRRSPK
jgi:methionine-rich copper-binding protein CopC